MFIVYYENNIFCGNLIGVITLIMPYTLIYIIYNKYSLKIRICRLCMESQVLIQYLFICTMYYKFCYSFCSY
jgi:hypothetical protein